DYCIILNGKFVSPDDHERNIKANAADPNDESFTIKSIELAMKNGFEIPRVEALIQSEAKYYSVLSNKDNEIFVKVITTEDFDAVYDAEVEEYMRMGGEEVMNEKRQAYRAQYGS